MALLGLGSYATIRWFFTDRAPSKWIGWGGVGLMLWAVVAWVKPDRSLRRRAGLDLHRAAADRRAGRAARVRRRHPAADDRRLAGRDPGRGLDRLDRRRRPPAAMGLRLEPVGEPERAHVARRRARGRERGRRSADRPADERRRSSAANYFDHDDPTTRHEHRLRVGEDLLQRVPHRPVGRSDRACRHLPGHGAELPGGAADDVVHRQRRLRRRRAVALLRGVPRPEQLVRRARSCPRTSCRASRSSPSRRSCS